VDVVLVNELHRDIVTAHRHDAARLLIAGCFEAFQFAGMPAPSSR
jgi:hypothetical protein